MEALVSHSIMYLRGYLFFNLTSHRGCVTPKQIENLEETIEGNLDFLDGYDEIDEESQAKVRKALEDGHVADNEWKGVRVPLHYWFLSVLMDPGPRDEPQRS